MSSIQMFSKVSSPSAAIKSSSPLLTPVNLKCLQSSTSIFQSNSLLHMVKNQESKSCKFNQFMTSSKSENNSVKPSVTDFSSQPCKPYLYFIVSTLNFSFPVIQFN
ncbi:hypothetical protein DFA_07141 [Cavenderia fasciculata]|uniref:Uncharacterized protein n=1 Tax=Cavenderia fasciculata TaxID=261658 RepID=F4PVL1_CACFS|nr:uncharacterized protein DFA_07141 [Cavenderia fasciculata]EGG20025.1 hypothetical protein DFA_07141 [Cavenderia fasciculata]|eukprot:XP_004367008.1 hypothetical protein DFA_07141 [Cavenderia fasciculata]